MHCIAVFALKGGVGKSAITVFLADFLSSIFDLRVLVVDLDPQQSTTIALLGEERLLKAMERGASLGRLLIDSLDAKPKAVNVLSYTTERPMVKESGRYKYLQALSVIASDREAWHDLDDRLSHVSVNASPQAWSYSEMPLVWFGTSSTSASSTSQHPTLARSRRTALWQLIGGCYPSSRTGWRQGI